MHHQNFFDYVSASLLLCIDAGQHNGYSGQQGALGQAPDAPGQDAKPNKANMFNRVDSLPHREFPIRHQQVTHP